MVLPDAGANAQAQSFYWFDLGPQEGMEKKPAGHMFGIVEVNVAAHATVTQAVEDADGVVGDARPAQGSGVRLSPWPQFTVQLHAQVPAGQEVGDQRALGEKSGRVRLELLQANRSFEFAQAKLKAGVILVIQIGIANRGGARAAEVR